MHYSVQNITLVIIEMNDGLQLLLENNHNHDKIAADFWIPFSNWFQFFLFQSLVIDEVSILTSNKLLETFEFTSEKCSNGMFKYSK